MKLFQFKDISAVIYDRNTNFKVDATIRSLAAKKRGAQLQLRWMGNPDGAVAFGRRMLEVSTLLAGQAEEKDKSATITDLEMLAKLARGAGDEFRRLIQHLALGTPPRTRPDDDAGKSVSTQISITTPLNHMYLRDTLVRGGTPDPRAMVTKAQQDSRILCEASDILRFIEDYATRTRDAVASDHLNPGSPQKLAFVEGLMRGWIYLTGKKPSEKNIGFSDFIADAWSDVCDEEFGDCVHSIRMAKDKVSDYEVTVLAQKGPEWK